MKGQAWKVWRGTPTTRRHFCSLNGAKKVKICPWVSEDELCATVLFFCLNHDQLVQFDQLYPWTLKNSTPEDQMKRKKWKILRGPSAKKKIKTPRPKSHPKKSSRPITNTSNPRFRDCVKFSETHVSQGTILYHRYPFASIVAFPCRLLALNLPVSYFSSQCLACDKHGPAILSWLFSVNLYHLCYLDDCPVFESPTVQTLDK